MANTIALKLFTPIREEALANAAITPGHLIELMSTGKIKVHASAGGNVKGAFFALEDELQGREIGTAYTAGELVQYNHFRPGDRVNAILADGETVVIGDELMSAGDGTLKKYVAQQDVSADITTIAPNLIVGIARTALDLSGSSAADPASARITCQII